MSKHPLPWNVEAEQVRINKLLDDQVDRAIQLADELEAGGLDVSYLDLLDALACTGLSLTPMPAEGNIASVAYLRELSSEYEQ